MKPAQSNDVGQLIRDRRQRAGITLDDLAHAIGCSKSHLSLMESGQRTVSLQWAGLIEKALGIKDAHIVKTLQWQSVPPAMRAKVEQSQSDSQALVSRIKRALASKNTAQTLRKFIDAPL